VHVGGARLSYKLGPHRLCESLHARRAYARTGRPLKAHRTLAGVLPATLSQMLHEARSPRAATVAAAWARTIEVRDQPLAELVREFVGWVEGLPFPELSDRTVQAGVIASAERLIDEPAHRAAA
jgi:DNA-binding transcriptional regulator YdaS (Cro superfamily)